MQQSQDQQLQAMTFDQGLGYLAEVAGTYSKSLDEVVRKPFVAYVNGAISAVQDHIKRQHEALVAARDELQPVQQESAEALNQSEE